MLTIRRDHEVHDKQGGWFRARWHFSFDDYRDPDNEGFGAMRVFNDDRLVPGAIWPLHPHRDIEGLTYVVEGLFGHEDNVGGAFGPLPAGSVQRMTLGSGAWHSERNASESEPMRFIQIWILPDTPSLPPGVEQRVMSVEDRTNRLLRVFAPQREIGASGSPDAGDAEGGDAADPGAGPVAVHQDASVYVARLEPGIRVRHELRAGRGAYAYLIDGEATFDGQAVATGDAAKVTDQAGLEIEATAASELIVVDVPLQFEPVGIWAGRV